MRISFLAAANTPLTKRFALENGELIKHSYPHVKRFTSHSYDIDTPEHFFTLTQQHATQGHCLLKGTLNRELSAESRAGSTGATDPTQWLLLDLDGVTGFNTAEDFIRTVLPPCFHDVTYVQHLSSSAGFEDKPGLNCHLAFLLDRPVAAPYLKLFLEALNYQHTALADQLALAASACALVYKLDITTCQNDKLIFIAPPVFEPGIEDPLINQPRIDLITHHKTAVTPDFGNPDPARVQADRVAAVARLRKDAGLPAKTIRYRTTDGVTYITNPDHAVVTGERIAREFVYLNLNNGDSWAYYYPENNPTYLYSFKDPGSAFRLADIVPDYAAQLQTRQRPVRNQEAPIPLMFRDWRTDTYWNGYYDPNSAQHTLYRTSSKDKLRDFAANNGLEKPDPVADWTMSFDPTTTTTIDLEKGWINKFIPTRYMLEAKPFPAMPFTIQKVLLHALGNCPETLDEFINWLAVAFTLRIPTLTAWVITGTEGTGKGLLYHNILAKLFGPAYSQQKSLDNLEDQFNEWEETCLLLNFNEARLSDSSATSRTMNRLKQMITEPSNTIRAMRTNQYTVRMHMNTIITSNNDDAITQSPEDRRFHVAPRQNEKLQISQAEIDALDAELMDFAGYLQQYPADRQRAATVKINEAKLAMQRASLTSTDQLFYALVNGELEYFTRFLETTPGLIDYANYQSYDRIVKRWLQQVDTECRVTHEELYAVYSYLQADRMPRKNKFTRLLSHHNIFLKRMRVEGMPTYGITTTWHCDDEIKTAWLAKITEANQPDTA